MNKAVVTFVKAKCFVHTLEENGLVLDEAFIAVSSPPSPPAPSTRIAVSGVPPFIPNESIEKELVRFGKFASGLKTADCNMYSPCRDKHSCA